MRHRLQTFRAGLVLLVALAVCRPGAGLAQPASEDFAGQINVAGHTVYLECRGTGSPTVVLESGYHELIADLEHRRRFPSALTDACGWLYQGV